MRILHVIDSLASAGGAENRFVEEIIRFDGSVEQSVVTLFERDDLLPRLRDAGIPVRCLGMRASSAGRTFPLAGLRLARIVRRERPDVIHTALFHADAAGQIAAILTRTPVVSSLVSSADVELRDKRPGGARRRAAVLDGIADRLAKLSRARYRSVSRSAAQTFLERSGLSPERVQVIPRGVDLKSTAGANRAAFGIPADAALIVNVARQDPRKGLVELIEAFAVVLARVPNAHLATAGRDGPETPAVREAVARLGLEDAVTLLGFRPDVAQLLAAADVFGFSSFSEGMPGAVLEAMAAGVPVVAFDIDPVREVSDDGRLVRLVPTGDVNALAEALVDALTAAAVAPDPDGAAARWVRQHYDAAEVARRVQAYLVEIGSGSQAPSSPSRAVETSPSGPVELGRGTLVISIDLEMEWGYIHHGEFGQRYEERDERSAIARTLEVFDRHEISATWATVGHLFLDGCTAAGAGAGAKHPEIDRPPYPWMTDDWFSADPCTTAAAAPTWYAPDVVEMIRACPTHQELASHSFAHMIAGDPARTAESFAADLRACQATAQASELVLHSFVYPRNSIGHIDELGPAGFRCFRGTSPDPFAGLSPTTARVLKVADRIRPLRRSAAYPRRVGDVWNIPQSFLFNPADRSHLRAWVLQAKRRLHQASRESSVFHLWFHPQNISQDPEVALAALETLLREARHLIDSGRLRNLTMVELASELDALHDSVGVRAHA